MPAPAVDVLAAAVFTRLAAVDLLTAFDGEIPNDGHGHDTLPMMPDGSGRVAPYAVLYAGAGRAGTLALAGSTDLDGWTFQITVAAGAQRDCLAAVRRVRDEFTDTLLAADSWRGIITEPPGDPGVLHRDNQISPPRFYVPILFLVPAVEGTQ